MSRSPLIALALVALGGCFEPKPFDPDPNPDARQQGGPATVTIRSYSWRTIGEVVLEAPVLVHDRSGALVQRTTSGVGSVTVSVPDGGSVTVIERISDVTTYVGVEDGDTIVVGSGGTVASDRVATVQLPAAPAGTDRYEIHGRCVIGSGPDRMAVPITIRGLCGVGPRDMLAIAEENGTQRNYLFQAGVNLVPDTANALTGSWLPVPNFTVSIGGLASAQNSTVTLGIRNRGRLVWGTGRIMPPPVGGTSTQTLRLPDAGDESYLGYATNSPDGSAQSYYQMQARATAYSANLTEHPLHRPRQLAANRVRVSWRVETRTLAPDGVFVSVQAMNGANFGAIWRFILPGASTEAAIPTLPSDLASIWQPTSIRASVNFEELSNSDAAAFRRDINSAIGAFSNSPAPVTYQTTSLSGTFSP